MRLAQIAAPATGSQRDRRNLALQARTVFSLLLSPTTPVCTGDSTPPAEATRSRQYEMYATLALGSAFALFLYPHALTGALSARSGNTIRRNATLLSFYSLALGII